MFWGDRGRPQEDPCPEEERVRSRDRRQEGREATEHVEAMVGDRIRETLEKMGGPQYAGELIGIAMGVDPAEFLVTVSFVQRRQDGDVARCHVCKEALSQTSVRALPVSYPRADGTRLLCLVLVDSDECQRELLGQA